MSNNAINEPRTSYPSLLIIILKEIRLERGIHQATFAQMAGKSPNAWSKIENGHSPLTMDVFLTLCSNLGLQPSSVMMTAERHVQYLLSYLPEEQWAVLPNLDVDDDDLLKRARDYYESPGFKSRPTIRNIPVLNSLVYFINNYGALAPLEVFGYCKDESFRKSQDNPEQPLPINRFY